MDKEKEKILFTTKQNAELIREVHLHCVGKRPRITIQDFVDAALRKALKENKK